MRASPQAHGRGGLTVIIEPNDPTPQNEQPEDVLAGFDQALADAGVLPEAEQEQPAEQLPEGDEKPAEQEPAGDPAKQPEAAAKPEGEPAKTEGVKPSDEFGELPKDTKAETRDRFEKLKTSFDTQAQELTEARAALKAAGIEDGAKFAEAIPKLAERARIGDEMLALVRETGASSEQYGATLDYLSLAKKAAGGDMRSAEAAYEFAMREAQVWGRLLGRDVTGGEDPLRQYPDLMDAVEGGEMTRERALAWAADRNQKALREDNDRRSSEATAAESQRVERHNAGVRALNELGATLEAADPTGYAAKKAALFEAVGKIKQDFPPEQWAAATRLAYQGIAAPAAASTQPVTQKPPMGPVRAQGPRPTMTQQFDDPAAALDFALSNMSG